MTRLTDIADDAAELLTRIANVLPERLYAMRDAMAGQPGAQHFEPVRSQATSLWCWTHEREVHRCHSQDKDCDGETIPLHDPAGEAAVRFDKATQDHRELKRYIGLAHHAARQCERILTTYQPATSATGNEPASWCRSCLRIQQCEPRYRGDLCRWCYDFDLSERQHPPISLLKAHHEGRRITTAMVTKALGPRPARDARQQPA